MKIFISQPMKGKTKEEIEADSSLVCRLLELAGHEVFGGYQDNTPKTKHDVLWCLGASLKILSRCDALLYIGERDKNTELPRGCEAEIHCAGSYGIPVFYGEEGLRRLCFQGLKEKA